VTDRLVLSGPTVTMFGDRDALDNALSDELGRRGRSTHSVTTPVGWLTSTTHAVVRLDTPSGDDAMRDLMTRDLPPTHIVAVCETPHEASARIDDACRRCGDRHEVSLIWHAAFEVELTDPPADTEEHPVSDPRRLAATIADEIDRQQEHPSGVSYASHVFDAHR
jgi:hypothetical protein